MATQKKEKQALKFLDPAKVLQEIGLEEGMQVADFGAGSGYFAFQASEMIGKNGNLYAMDVQKAVIDHLNKEIKHQGLTNFKTVWTDLEMVGHNPIPAGNIDLVLMDIKLPELNGYESTKQIRQFNNEVIIFAQTAYALMGDREKAIESGCNDYISKPILKDELQALIQKYFKS